MTESPLVDSGFAVPVFSLGDDPIACLNKAMDFLTAVASLRFPSTNNQLRTSLNPRNQATIQDGRVIVQQVQGRQGQGYSSTGYKSNATSSGGNNASGQEKPKRPRNAAWYKEKAMFAEAQEAGQILDEEQLTFLADPGVPDSQAVQTIIPNNAAFHTEDLDTYDSDYDDISNAKAVLMANISIYGSDVILEVPHSETYLNDMENQSVHAMPDFEQTPAVDFTDNEIHSDSNIIMYSQYLQETQQENVQDTNLQHLVYDESDLLPHAHTQATKSYYKHQGLRIKKAQELKTKTSANSDIKDNSSETKLRGRLLESFQEDAKYEHVGQDTRSQGGKDDQDIQGKI
ncbi:hypothetical protein Tco_1336580 [Tanacetum coccineum]